MFCTYLQIENMEREGTGITYNQVVATNGSVNYRRSNNESTVESMCEYCLVNN